MAFVFEEAGRNFRVGGTSADDERTYIAVGYADEAAAVTAVVATAPASIGGMILDEVTGTELADVVGTWRVTARYKLYEKQQPPEQRTSSSPDPSSEDDGELSFDVGVETVKLQWSKSTEKYNVDDSDPVPDLDGAINWNPKTKVPEGVEIFDPCFSWSETHYIHESKMTRAYRQAIRNCVGKVNDSIFRDNYAGEVLCMPVSGRKRSKHDYALTFNFKARENVTLDAFGITGINKKGWQYMEAVYRKGEDATTKDPAPRVVGVYVHTVFDEANFSGLGIGT